MHISMINDWKCVGSNESARFWFGSAQVQMIQSALQFLLHHSSMVFRLTTAWEQLKAVCWMDMQYQSFFNHEKVSSDDSLMRAKPCSNRKWLERLGRSTINFKLVVKHTILFTKQSHKHLRCPDRDSQDIHPALQWVKYTLSPKKRDTPESPHRASSPHQTLPQRSILLNLLPANIQRIMVIRIQL
jgi:hypothetical protein